MRALPPSGTVVSGSLTAGPPSRLGAPGAAVGSAAVGSAAMAGASLRLVTTSPTVAGALSCPQRSRATTLKLSARASPPSCT